MSRQSGLMSHELGGVVGVWDDEVRWLCLVAAVTLDYLSIDKAVGELCIVEDQEVVVRRGWK